MESEPTALLFWQIPVNGSHRWCPTPRISHLTRLPHQGVFCQLCTSLTVPVCWGCLLRPMNDRSQSLSASGDMRLSLGLTCSWGHGVQIRQQVFHTGCYVGQTYGGTNRREEKAGDVCRMYNSLGRKKEWRKMAIASCICKWQRRSPTSFSWLSCSSKQHLITSFPRGDPSRLAWLEWTNCRPGKADSKLVLMVRLLWDISSDLFTLRNSP